VTLWFVLGTVAGGGLLVFAATVLVRARVSPTAIPCAPASGATDPGAVDRLIEGLVGVHDLAEGSAAVRSQVCSVLRQAGVEIITDEPGCLFDPARQTVVDRRIGDDGQRGTVSRVVRPGWRRGETVIRPMEVVLWTS
jgi:hypothetical protein